MAVKIPVRAEYDGKGLKQLKAEIRDSQRLTRLSKKLEREITREERAQIRAVKEQISQRKRLNRLSKKLDRDLEKQRTQTRTQFTNVVGAVTTALAAAAAASAKAVQMANIQAQAEAQLEARIRSTGAAAGVSANEAKKLASALQNVTNIGDESTIAAEAMLLSFTNIGKETFPRATKVTLDMATAMANGATPSAEQLKNQSIQLGKALNDPIKGLTALQRVGVQFTEAQKAQIKALAESGQMAEAQGMILAELEKEFGGSAEAARKADGGFIALGNSFGDLQESLGFLIKDFNEASGAVENLIGFVDRLNQGAQAWRGVAKDIRTMSRALEILNEEQSGAEQTTNAITDSFTLFGTNIGKPIRFVKDLTINHKDLTEAMVQAGQEIEEEYTPAIVNNTGAIEDNAKALEEAQKRIEKVAEIRRTSASKLLDIDAQAQKKTTEEWDRFFEQEAEDWKDHNETIADLREKAGQDIAKIDADLAKDLKKSAKDLQKDLTKIDKNETKQVAEVKERAAKEQQRDEKRRKIDALADERLFNFELRNLAAEGAANQIREALERRAIEQQIAEEKAAVEAQIEDEKQKDQIAKIKEAAQEQRDEARQTAAEREQELRDNAELEKAIRQEKLGTEIADEQEHYAEQIAARRQYRDEKLAEIEAEKAESIKKLASELQESKDLTQTELRSLAVAAGELGQEAGAAFSSGLSEGMAKIQEIANILGEGADFTAPTRAGAGASSGLGFPGSGSVPGFQHGGRVPGPIGRPRLIMAHGGEEFNNPTMPRAGGGASVHVDLRGAQFGSNLSQADLQQFADDIANGIVEQALGPMVN